MKKLFFVLLCWMIPMFVYADDTIEYKVYDQQGNYEFSCQYHSLEGMINDESLKYDLSYCISKNKNNISNNRIEVEVNGYNVTYTIQNGTGQLQWDGEIDTNWYQEDAVTYYIQNKEQLAGLAYLVNFGVSFEGKTVILENDIDLENKAWFPIGKNLDYYFNGTFDGNGHTIFNLTFSLYDDVYNYGIFGYLNNATIKNLNIDEANIQIQDNTQTVQTFKVGLVAGETVSSTIKNIVLRGKMNVSLNGDSIGAVVGEGNYTTLQFIQSYVDITAHVFNLSGMIAAGYNLTITDCVNFGNLHSSYDGESARVAGIVAWGSNANIDRVVNYGTITIDHSMLASSIIGYVGYGGESHSDVYSDDNLNIINGNTKEKSDVITPENQMEILSKLQQDSTSKWQLQNGVIINVLESIPTEPIIKTSVSGFGKVYYVRKENNVMQLILKPDLGYVVKNIQITDSNGQVIAISDDNMFTMPSKDILISVQFAVQTATVTDRNLVYDNADLVLHLLGSILNLKEIQINHQVLDSVFYQIDSQNNQIVISKEYLDSLEEGTYTISLVYIDDQVVTTQLIIIKNPSTGDHIMNYIGLGAFSFLTMTLSGFVLLKRKYEKDLQ